MEGRHKEFSHHLPKSNGMARNQPLLAPPKTNSGQSYVYTNSVFSVIGARYRRCLAQIKLMTSSPIRDPAEENEKAEEWKIKGGGEKEKIYQKIREEKQQDSKDSAKTKKKMVAVTWDVQEASTQVNNRGRLRRICEHLEKRKWEVVMLSEIRSEEDGIAWFGEGENLTAAVHFKRTAVILRGVVLTKWCEEKKRRIHGTRTTSINIENYDF